MECEICGLPKISHKDDYHQQIENILRLIHRGYIPAMLAWTHLKDDNADGIITARDDDGAIFIDEHLLENQWRKKRISFKEWKSLIDRIKGGEPLWKVADEDTLAGSYLRYITDLYTRMQNTDKINLKWSLWTTDFSIWMEYAPLYYDLMRIGLDTGELISVDTAPSKEIRFGNVDLRREGKIYVAVVDFYTEWDEASAIAENYVVEADAYDRLVEFIAQVSPGGARISKTVTAKTFSDLMKKIDAAESQLLEEDERASKQLKANIREYLR